MTTLGNNNCNTCDGGNKEHHTLAMRYPGLTRLMIFVAFEQTDTESEPNYQQIIFTADSEAAFRLDCSQVGCTMGGFDFAPLVAELVQSGDTMLHGKLACCGKLDSGEPCGLTAEYRIIIG